VAQQKIHPGWIAVTVTFFTLMASAGYRSAPSVLIVPLEEAFGWSRSQISLAVSINVLLFGLVAPFAAALMERFTVRKVVMSALALVSISATSTIFMTQPWHLWALWGIGVGIGAGSMALVFAATVANRWFIAKKGIVVGALTAATASGQLVFLPMLSHFAIAYGWKSVSLTVGGAAALVIPFIYLFLKEKPELLGLAPYGAPDNWQPPAPNELSAGHIAIDTLKVSSRSKRFLDSLWNLLGMWPIN
jgi:MFS family permease